MGKLSNLKEWLTVAETARHLSIIFGEDVTEADVLRLAIDGRLLLSVFINRLSNAVCGKFVQFSQAELEDPVNTGKSQNDVRPLKVKDHFHIPGRVTGKPSSYLTGCRANDDRYLILGSEITKISGLWDLPMIGDEYYYIAYKYNELTGNPFESITGLDGAFLEGSEGRVCQLQQSYDFEDSDGSRARLESLKQYIRDNNIPATLAEELISHDNELHNEVLARAKSQPLFGYFPSCNLPEDSKLVVRAEALREFEKSINGSSTSTDKPLTTTERNTLLTIVGIMAKKGYGFDLSKPYECAKEIQRDADGMGIKIGDDTIAAKLKEAAKILAEKSQ